MKKFYKVFAAVLAIGLIAGTPAASLTTHAQGMGFNPNAHDDTDYGEMPSDYWETRDPSTGEKKSNESSSNQSQNDQTASAPNVDAGISGSSGGNGSVNESGGMGFNPDAHDDTDYGEMPDDYWTKNDPNDVPTKVEGGQTFRSVMNGDHTVYEVYHCGVSVATFIVTDAEGNRVAFKNVALEKGEDGLWYLNITFAEGVDVTGYVVSLTKGDLFYLAEQLGVSGLMINGVNALSTLPVTDTDAADTADTDKADRKESESGKETAGSTETAEEPEVIGARVCWCGYTMNITDPSGLSAADKAVWRAHQAAHVNAGEATNYSEVSY